MSLSLSSRCGIYRPHFLPPAAAQQCGSRNENCINQTIVHIVGSDDAIHRQSGNRWRAGINHISYDLWRLFHFIRRIGCRWQGKRSFTTHATRDIK